MVLHIYGNCLRWLYVNICSEILKIARSHVGISQTRSIDHMTIRHRPQQRSLPKSI